MRARSFAIGVLLLVGSSCRTSDENTWTYALSRSAYDGLEHRAPSASSENPMQGAGKQAILLPIILLAPFVIDTVILPVTLTHDILVSN